MEILNYKIKTIYNLQIILRELIHVSQHICKRDVMIKIHIN